MATENTPDTTPEQKLPEEIKVVSHSSLFYWWPVWVIGFLMGIISLFFPGYQLATVPKGSHVATLTQEVEAELPAKEGQSAGAKVPLKKGTHVIVAEGETRPDEPGVSVSTSSKPGVVFAIVLLIVITITNIHLRGLWSLVVVVIIVALVVILALIPGAWEFIFAQFRILDIRISTGGYFFISLILFAIWVIVTYVFDRQRYMLFTPGQFKVRLEIGEGETSYDTRGMIVKKERSDFFRHWILGLGSGDLIVNTTGARSVQFDLPNVLFLNRQVKQIQEMVAQAGRVDN